jgi:hypothetical protein
MGSHVFVTFRTGFIPCLLQKYTQSFHGPNTSLSGGGGGFDELEPMHVISKLPNFLSKYKQYMFMLMCYHY